MKVWDTVVIKTASNDANKGRAGVVQAIDEAAGTAVILLDATPDGKAQEAATSKIADCQFYPVF